MILVYDYMSKGMLADYLHNQSTLSWSEWLKICIGAGRGMDYRHSGCSITHRDVKPTNILLDENYTTKVSDFGLAKHLGHDILKRVISSQILKVHLGILIQVILPPVYIQREAALMRSG